MGQSFGNEFTLAEVTTNERREGVSNKRLWIAAAKPDQGLKLVSAAIPPGWSVAFVGVEPLRLKIAKRLNLKPGDVRELSSSPS
jgi:hypothetical protein